MTANSAPKPSSYWQQTLQNQMLLVVLCMVVFVPLLASPSASALHSWAVGAMRMMAALLAGILVLRARLAQSREEVLEFLRTGANLPILLFLLLSCLSAFFAPADIRRLALNPLMGTLTGTLLYFALVYHVRRSEHLVKLLDALTLVAGLIAALALFRFTAQGMTGSVALFSDHQLLAAFLVVLFPVTLLSALNTFNKAAPRRRTLTQVAAALTGLSLALMGSLSTWAAIIVEMAAIAGFSQIRPPNKQRRPLDRRLLIAPLVLVIVSLALIAALARLSERDSAGGSALYQRRMWTAARRMVAERPLLGYGPGSFGVYQARYGDANDLGPQMPESASAARRARNFWLQLITERGLVGALTFLAIPAVFLAMGVRRLRQMETGIRRTLLMATLAAVPGFLIDALGNPAWEFDQATLFFWLALGIGVSCLRPQSVRKEKSAP